MEQLLDTSVMALLGILASHGVYGPVSNSSFLLKHTRAGVGSSAWSLLIIMVVLGPRPQPGPILAEVGTCITACPKLSFFLMYKKIILNSLQIKLHVAFTNIHIYK